MILVKRGVEGFLQPRLIACHEGNVISAIDGPTDQFQLRKAVDVIISHAIVGDRGIENAGLHVFHGVGIAIVNDRLNLIIFFAQLFQAQLRFRFHPARRFAKACRRACPL